MHLTTSPVDWYAARAAGVVAYLLLSSVVALGLAMAGKKSMRLWPRFALEDVHRFGGILVGTFVAIHVVTVAIDAYLPFSLTSLLVPLTARYRPVWTGLGVVAAELMVALAVTNHYRNRRISYRTWRLVHYLNFAVWAAATLHGLGSGTDRSTPWLLAIYAVSVATVCSLIAWRVLRRYEMAPQLVRLGSAGTAFVAVVLIAWLALGPLRFQPKPWNAAAFRDRLSGRIHNQSGISKGIISMSGTGVGSQNVVVRADLLVSTEALLSTNFQMEYLPSGTVCRGTVVNVHPYGFEATCRLPSGETRFVQARWSLGRSSRLEGGVLTSHA